MTYLDRLARLIRSQLPAEAQPPAGSGPLFRLYAVLLLAKGEHVTDEDVHNALAAWMQTTGGARTRRTGPAAGCWATPPHR